MIKKIQKIEFIYFARGVLINNVDEVNRIMDNAIFCS